MLISGNSIHASFFCIFYRKPGDNKNGTIHDDYSDPDSFSSISASQYKTQEMPPLSTSLVSQPSLI